MSRKWICVVFALAFVVTAASGLAATEQDVTLTVTIRSLGVSVSPTSYGFGVMNLGDTKVSDTALVVTNEGNAAEDIGIRIKTEDDAGDWSAAATQDENQYVLSSRLATNAGTFGANDLLTTTVVWGDGVNFAGGGNDMAAAATVNQWFEFQAPTSVTGASATAEHTITVEVSCRAAQ